MKKSRRADYYGKFDSIKDGDSHLSWANADEPALTHTHYDTPGV